MRAELIIQTKNVEIDKLNNLLFTLHSMPNYCSIIASLSVRYLPDDNSQSNPQSFFDCSTRNEFGWTTADFLTNCCDENSEGNERVENSGIEMGESIEKECEGNCDCMGNREVKEEREEWSGEGSISELLEGRSRWTHSMGGSWREEEEREKEEKEENTQHNSQQDGEDESRDKEEREEDEEMMKDVWSVMETMLRVVGEEEEVVDEERNEEEESDDESLRYCESDVGEIEEESAQYDERDRHEEGVNSGEDICVNEYGEKARESTECSSIKQEIEDEMSSLSYYSMESALSEQPSISVLKEEGCTEWDEEMITSNSNPMESSQLADGNGMGSVHSGNSPNEIMDEQIVNEEIIENPLSPSEQFILWWNEQNEENMEKIIEEEEISIDLENRDEQENEPIKEEDSKVVSIIPASALSQTNFKQKRHGRVTCEMCTRGIRRFRFHSIYVMVAHILRYHVPFNKKIYRCMHCKHSTNYHPNLIHKHLPNVHQRKRGKKNVDYEENMSFPMLTELAHSFAASFPYVPSHFFKRN